MSGQATTGQRAAIPSEPSSTSSTRLGDLKPYPLPREERSRHTRLDHTLNRKEGDLLLGRHWTQVATVVERTTRFTVLAQLDNREMTTVTAGLKRVMPRLPAELRKTLTWDRGMELADHKNVTIDTGLAIYFAGPRSPWQRGTNENTVSVDPGPVGLMNQAGVGSSR